MRAEHFTSQNLEDDRGRPPSVAKSNEDAADLWDAFTVEIWRTGDRFEARLQKPGKSPTRLGFAAFDQCSKRLLEEIELLFAYANVNTTDDSRHE